MRVMIPMTTAIATPGPKDKGHDFGREEDSEFMKILPPLLHRFLLRFWLEKS